MNPVTLAELLTEAAEHHHAYEASHPHDDWEPWYAAYIYSRMSGGSQDDAILDANRYMAFADIKVPA